MTLLHLHVHTCTRARAPLVLVLHVFTQFLDNTSVNLFANGVILQGRNQEGDF